MATSVEPGLAPGTLTEVEVADPKNWFEARPMAELSAQTLYRNNGYAITMLTLDDDDLDDGGPEVAVDRYTQWG
ncbi:MAG: hypothetical protein AAFP13_04750 [Pseudomonadota bacterium]